MRECESVLYGVVRIVSGVSNLGLKCLFIIVFVGLMVKYCKKKRYIYFKFYKLQQWNLLYIYVYNFIYNNYFK